MLYIVILRVEPCWLFRSNKAINKLLSCTCFKQLLNNRLFIHNMLHHIVILRVEPCWLFRSNKAMNKPLWCTCSKQFLNSRIFIHNMLHHIVRLRVEPCWFFSPLSLFSYFYFWKENSFATLAYKNIKAQNLLKYSWTLVTRTLVYLNQTFIFSNYFSCPL